jgi:HEAT repeat protein
MFGDAADAPALIDTLRTLDDAEQQALVAVAMGFHGTPAALTGLIAAARDEQLAGPARASAIEALGLILDPHPGLMLSDISRSANFFDFPGWLVGALTSVTL